MGLKADRLMHFGLLYRLARMRRDVRPNHTDFNLSLYQMVLAPIPPSSAMPFSPGNATVPQPTCSRCI
jgi:hypothetical protein